MPLGSFNASDSSCTTLKEKEHNLLPEWAAVLTPFFCIKSLVCVRKLYSIGLLDFYFLVQLYTCHKRIVKLGDKHL